MRTPVSLRAADLDAEYFKKVVSVGKALHKLITDSPRLVEFLEKLEKQSSRSSASISSMVDSKDIELVLNQTQELNKLGAPDLPLLNTQAAIEKIAGVTKGTVAGGAAQLDRLQQAGNQRQNAIKKLEEAKNEAANLATSYTKTAEAADAVSKQVEKLVGDPVVEVIVLAHGQNFALSWLDLAEGLVPALWARADAARGVERRLGSAIKLAKADLEGFETSRQYAEKLWEPAEMAVQDLKLKGIREEMDRGTKRAMEQAKALREEADKIDQHNARLQNAQNLVNLIGSAAGLANAAAGGGGGTGTTTKTTTIYYDGPNGYAMGRTVTTTKP